MLRSVSVLHFVTMFLRKTKPHWWIRQNWSSILSNHYYVSDFKLEIGTYKVWRFHVQRRFLSILLTTSLRMYILTVSIDIYFFANGCVDHFTAVACTQCLLHQLVRLPIQVFRSSMDVIQNVTTLFFFNIHNAFIIWSRRCTWELCNRKTNLSCQLTNSSELIH